MQKSNLNLVDSRVPGTWGSLLVFVGFLLVGMAIGNVLAVLVLALFLSADAGSVVNLITQLITDPETVPNGWSALVLLQGTVHFFSYLLPALLFWFFIERKAVSDFNLKRKPEFKIWLLAFLLVLVFIPLNSKFIEWNANMTLPDSLAGLESWMRDKEDKLEVQTVFMTSFTGFGQLLAAIFVMALLAALGEEVVFRGILQTKLFQQWGNIHAAIWTSAIIFSAIHFQFYGFLPRMLLGALFGYLYYWSGSLWITIFAHFVNNAFLVFMVYLNNIKIINIDIQKSETMSLPMVLTSLLLTALVIFTIKKDGLKQEIVGKEF